MSQTLDKLRDFNIPGITAFEAMPGGLIRLVITAPHGEAHIYLHGAHVTHYQPAGGAPVLFMSAESHFSPGIPIRGGVPLIFPWFGARAEHPASPMHGFARTADWELAAVAVNEEGFVAADFRLTSSDRTRELWPHDFTLTHRVTVAKHLLMTLEVENTSAAPFVFENAQHTYLAVHDVRETAISGLENAPYLDKTDAMQRKTQEAAPIRITAETDRIFESTRATCILDDPDAARRITVEKAGSDTTVVWNPWTAKAAALPDFGDDEWPHMLCIETANAGANAITLAPGAKHSMRTILSTQPR